MHRCSHCCAVTTNKTQGATSWQVPNEHLQHHILHWTWETAIIIIIIIIVIAKAIFKSWPFIMSLCFVKWREGESHTIHLAAQVSKLSESRSRPQLTVWLCPARWRHGGGGGEEKALRYLSGKYLKIPSPSTNCLFLMDLCKGPQSSVWSPYWQRHRFLVENEKTFRAKTHDVLNAPGAVTLPRSRHCLHNMCGVKVWLQGSRRQLFSL